MQWRSELQMLELTVTAGSFPVAIRQRSSILRIFFVRLLLIIVAKVAEAGENVE